MTRVPAGWGFTGDLEIAPTRAPTVAHVRRSPRKPQAQVCFWLGSLRYVPTVDEIRQRWDVSRATAYRYRAFALSAGSTDAQPLQTNPHRFDKRTSA